MTSLAIFIGYFIICLFSIVFISVFLQWCIYGQVGNYLSSKICDNSVYINGKLVAVLEDSANISVVNGSVYQNSKLIYKHKRKFRWQK